jgi:surface antigen
MAALTIPVFAGGCSYQLGSLLGKDGPADSTGTVGPASAQATAATHTPSDSDIAIASAAAAAALSKSGADASLPWENPHTGARGTVTPLANAYTQDGFVCRDFLASFVRDKMESWLQGEACRLHQGKWVVRSLKPWART